MSRIAKVNSVIQEELGKIFQREFEWQHGTLVTISKVDTSPNLAHAKVFLSILPKGKQKEIIKKAKESVYGIQKQLNKKMHMRPVPKITFQLDHGEEYAAHIEDIIEQEKRKNEDS